jgi:UDP-N-acetylglucosamine/UDP-N-acetylgalactosamine 4-epimerase
MMSNRYEIVLEELKRVPRTWLVTGVAGFIGSNLLESLLNLKQNIVGLDNFATGLRKNFDDVKSNVPPEAWKRFRFVEGDITDAAACKDASKGVDYVLHQGALGSVPRSIANPLATNKANVEGFLQVLSAARDAKAKRFVFASSSSIYGDDPTLPRVEDKIGAPLSPYAASKRVGELYALAFSKCYPIQIIGLRYFNVFGKRQDPNSAYAAVIPKWVGQLLQGERPVINGDGETSRDFAYIANVVQANILAATVTDDTAVNDFYNVAFGSRITLNVLFALIRDGLAQTRPELKGIQPDYQAFRAGDVRHSLADISRIASRLGYAPQYSVQQGLAETLPWYVAQYQ